MGTLFFQNGDKIGPCGDKSRGHQGDMGTRKGGNLRFT